MTKVISWLKLAAAAAGAWIGAFIGPCDGLLIALIAFMSIDYLTGVGCAIVAHNVSSEIGFKGLFRKTLILVIVGVGNLIDTKVLAGGGAVIRSAVIFYYLSNEGISILENAGRLGLPIPERLKNVLEQLRHKSDGDDQ